MVEKALYKNLELYNGTIANDYRGNWGSLLSYIDSDDTNVLCRASNKVKVEEQTPAPQRTPGARAIGQINIRRRVVNNQTNLPQPKLKQAFVARMSQIKEHGSISGDSTPKAHKISRGHTQVKAALLDRKSAQDAASQKFYSLDPLNRLASHVTQVTSSAEAPFTHTSTSILQVGSKKLSTFDHSSNYNIEDGYGTQVLRNPQKAPQFMFLESLTTPRGDATMDESSACQSMDGRILPLSAETSVQTSGADNTAKFDYEAYPKEEDFVYRSARRHIRFSNPKCKKALQGTTRDLQRKSAQSEHQTTRRQLDFSSTSPRTVSRRIGTTHYGFPSTLNQGKRVKIYGDNDRFIENMDMVTKQDFIQSAIKSFRLAMKDKGANNNAQDEEQDGIFGGFKRVGDGFLHTHTQLQGVPEPAKRVARQQREEILRASRRRGAPQGLASQSLSHDKQRGPEASPTAAGQPVAPQLALDQKLANLKSMALSTRYGPQNQSARNYLRSFDSAKWVSSHKFGEVRSSQDSSHQAEEEYVRKTIQFAKDLFMTWDDDASGVLEADEIVGPLISLGLVPNAQFAIKLLQALDHRLKNKDADELTITLKDFIKIFRTSKAAQAILDLVQRETHQRLKRENLAMKTRNPGGIAPQEQNYGQSSSIQKRQLRDKASFAHEEGDSEMSNSVYMRPILPLKKHVRISDCYVGGENSGHPGQSLAISTNSYSIHQDNTIIVENLEDLSLAMEDTNFDITRDIDSHLKTCDSVKLRSCLNHPATTVSSQCGLSLRVSAQRQSVGSGAGSRKPTQASLTEHLKTIREMWLTQSEHSAFRMFASGSIMAHSKAHFRRPDNFMTDELPLKPILAFFVREGVALDRDKARAAIQSEIGPLDNDSKISFGEFQSIFVRGIFKQALENRAEAFKEYLKNKSLRAKDLNLRQQIDLYQRGQMIQGLKSAQGTELNIQTKMVLDNINQYKKSATSTGKAIDHSRESYLKFLANPDKFFKNQNVPSDVNGLDQNTDGLNFDLSMEDAVESDTRQKNIKIGAFIAVTEKQKEFLKDKQAAQSVRPQKANEISNQAAVVSGKATDSSESDMEEDAIVPIPFGRTRQEKVDEQTKTLKMMQGIMRDDDRNVDMSGQVLKLNNN